MAAFLPTASRITPSRLKDGKLCPRFQKRVGSKHFAPSPTRAFQSFQGPSGLWSELLDLAKKSTRHSVKSEFQINNERFNFCIYCFSEIQLELGSCILPGNPLSDLTLFSRFLSRGHFKSTRVAAGPGLAVSPGLQIATVASPTPLLSQALNSL